MKPLQKCAAPSPSLSLKESRPHYRFINGSLTIRPLLKVVSRQIFWNAFYLHSPFLCSDVSLISHYRSRSLRRCGRPSIESIFIGSSSENAFRGGGGGD